MARRRLDAPRHRDLDHARTAPSPDGDDRTLVVVELAGGNDGLNTVVPIADPAYRPLRPTLGVSEPDRADDTIGLAPELGEAGGALTTTGTSRPSRASATRIPTSALRAPWPYWRSGPARGCSAYAVAGSDATSTPTVGYDDPLAAVSIGPLPSPALLGSRLVRYSIADATGPPAAASPSWVDTPDDLVAAWSRFALPQTRPDDTDGRDRAGHPLHRVGVARARGTVAGPRGNRRRRGGLPPGAERNLVVCQLAAQLVVGDRGRRRCHLRERSRRLRHPPGRSQASSDSHTRPRRRARRVLRRARCGRRLRSRVGDDDVRVRTTSGRERQRHRSRDRGAAFPDRRVGARREVRRAALAHAAGRAREPRRHHRLPLALRHRAAGLARCRRRTAHGSRASARCPASSSEQASTRVPVP